MRAEYLQEGDTVMVLGEPRVVVTKLIPTVVLDDGTVLPRMMDVAVLTIKHTIPEETL